MEYPAYCCDVCEADKGEANHWFAVWAIPEVSFKALPWEEARQSSSLSNAEHICGQECLHKRLSQWLENNSRPAPANSQEAV